MASIKTVTYTGEGDFAIGRDMFEVGGKDKQQQQVKNFNRSFVAADGIEIGHEHKIPLWMFGLLYWKMNRLCIYPKDIQRITGRSERYGRNVIKEIKMMLNKAPHQFVTIEEFANYAGLEISTIITYIED